MLNKAALSSFIIGYAAWEYRAVALLHSATLDQRIRLSKNRSLLFFKWYPKHKSLSQNPPFMHRSSVWWDRTSDRLKRLIQFKKLEEISKHLLNPAHPMILEHSQGPDADFQTCWFGNKYYSDIIGIVQANMNESSSTTTYTQKQQT